MNITYIGHSGFLVETETENYLFDYYKGQIPEMERDKPLFVFASHRHEDHFNPQIFKLADRYSKVTFVLSYDIKVKPFHLQRWQVGEEILEKIVTVRANEEYDLGAFLLQTLKSTDAGVAFLLSTSAGTIYHAGDLNWWYWEGDDKQSANNMAAAYRREIQKLTDVSIDVAFVPLDPRLGAGYYLGLEYLLQNVQVRMVFPMHFWGDFSVTERFRKEGHGAGKSDRIRELKKEGESFTIL